MHTPSARSIGLPRQLGAALIHVVLTGTVIILSGCGNIGPSNSIGEAYIAPATLNLRRELTSKNASVAVLSHGDRVSIVDVRRRFVKVRTSKGQEGWVDSLQLLSPEQMEQINRDAQQARDLPSEGSATVFESLNVHIAPDRQSPAFARIQEGTYIEVLGHRLAPKANGAPQPPAWIGVRPQPLSRKQKKERQLRAAAKLPPPPAPPKAPANWEELSAERIAGSESTAAAKARRQSELAARKAEEAKKPVVLEDWTLVRTKDRQSGWVLSRNLSMAIPDEVAQYAEGKRITSFFDLGAVQDEEKGPKHNWLWTTSSKQISYDFDGWRVFIWNRRKHRYETSYRQREVEGYFPVRLDPPDPNVFGRTFHLITNDDAGGKKTKTYAFDGTRVHLVSSEDYRPRVPEDQEKPGTTADDDDGKPETTFPGKRTVPQRWNALKERFSGSR